MRKLIRRKSAGQAIVEYVIIIVIVAVASLTLLGMFSDRIRTIIAGVATTFGSEDAQSEVESRSSTQILREMDASGIDTESSN